jgi:hypothetical protein
MDATQDGGYKVRSRMILFDENGKAVALCPTCKHRVAVPIQLGNISPLPMPKTRLIVRG